MPSRNTNRSSSDRALASNAPTASGGSGVGTVLKAIATLLLIAGWVFVAGSLLGFNRYDPPTHLISPANDPVHNWCGLVGAKIAYGLIKLLGASAYVLIFLAGVGLLSHSMSKSEQSMGARAIDACVRTLGLLMFCASIAGLQSLIFPGSGPFPKLAGGQIGVVAKEELLIRFGDFGSGLILLLCLIIGALVAMDRWVIALFSWGWNVTRERAVPAAAVVGAAAGSHALNMGGMATKAAARASARAGGGLFSAIAGWINRKAGGDAELRVRENDLDDSPDVPGVPGTQEMLPRGRKGTTGTRAEDAESIAREIEDPDYAPENLGAADAGDSIAEYDSSRDEDDWDADASGGASHAGVIDEDEDDEIGAELEAEAIKQAKREAREAEKRAKEQEKLAAKQAKLAEKNKPTINIKKLEPTPAVPAPDEAEEANAKAPVSPEADAEADADEGPGAPQVYSESQLREKVEKLPIFFGTKDKQVATDADLSGLQTTQGIEGVDGDAAKPYQFPPMEMLENPEENFNSKLEEHVRDQASALVAALEQFRIDGEVDSIESGPVITLFHVRLSPGTKVAALEAVSKDIARVLKAQNIRIVPNMAGRDTVGIEVPNTHKERVRLKELMGKTEKFSGMKLPMFLGKDASGEPLIEDLAKMPHMLIAGTTGSGKSVCMNTIIMGFLYSKKPSELKMVLVDPKMVEMSQFKDIPHLMCPVVTEMSKAAAILEWACRKMDERYELLADAGCRDISSYNELTWEELKERFNPKTPEEEARIPRRLPYMVFVIDELADLMMTAKEVESHIIRIAQKARAVGIHLILATQRPQANVVTGLIKSNMPCRIAFKVASGMDSRIVLDQKGGELLLGHGDMLFLSPRSSKLTRAQGTLVDDAEIRKVVRFMRDIAGPSFERSLIQIRSGDGDEQRVADSQNNSSASLQAAQEDPLFGRAVEIVLETRRGSVSLLQRRLAIGYTRSSRLIDLMGIAGIISDHKGSVARDVLITPQEWEAMKKLAAEQGISMDGSTQGALFDEKEPAESVETLETDTGAQDAAASDDDSADDETIDDSAEPHVEYDEEAPFEDEDETAAR